MITAGIMYGLSPVYMWVGARFGTKDPAFDFDLVYFAFTHCLIYLYFVLATSGIFIDNKVVKPHNGRSAVLVF